MIPQLARSGRRTGPDFLYVGTSKAGSTWLFNALARHPQVYLPSDKGLYYFDQQFDRGEAWYRANFADRGSAVACGEISHSYLSAPEAASRIASFDPTIRLLACLREPADRAFSDYLDLVKNGVFDGSFEDALERFPRLVDRGRYAEHLHRYRELFEPDQLCVQLFDDLRSDPAAYAEHLFAFLGVDRIEMQAADLRPRMQAGVPRSRGLAAATRRASRIAVGLGLRKLRSRVKRSAHVRHALYRPYGEDRPRMADGTRRRLRAGFADDVRELDAILGSTVSARWGYDG